MVKCASPRNISITRLSRWAIACSPAAMRLCTRWITSRMPRTRRQEPRVSHRGTRRTSVTSISLRTRTSSFTILSTRLRSIRRRRAGATRPPSGRSTTRSPRAPSDWLSPTMIRSATTKRSIASWRCVAGAPALPGAALEVFAAAEGQELRFIERDAKTPAAARAPEPARKVGRAYHSRCR